MQHRIRVPAAIALAAAVVAGAIALEAAPAKHAAASTKGSVPTAATPAAAGPAVPIKIEGVDNTFRIGSKIYSGACPVGEAGYRALARLGVRTVLSVDGERPDVELARKAGLRYVHIPIAYGGMTRAQELHIARAVRDLPALVYIHCHHGQVRGPSAAMIAAIANENWTNAEARAELKQAGFKPVYVGLWANVSNFRKPTKAELDHADNSYPSVVALRPLPQTMVGIDERWSQIDAMRKAGWRAPASHPDLEPAQQALLENEDFQELLRTPYVQKRPAEFKKRMATAVDLTRALEIALRGKNNAKADATFAAMSKTCDGCHAIYRNPDINRKG